MMKNLNHFLGDPNEAQRVVVQLSGNDVHAAEVSQNQRKQGRPRKRRYFG